MGEREHNSNPIMFFLSYFDCVFQKPEMDAQAGLREQRLCTRKAGCSTKDGFGPAWARKNVKSLVPGDQDDEDDEMEEVAGDEDADIDMVPEEAAEEVAAAHASGTEPVGACHKDVMSRWLALRLTYGTPSQRDLDEAMTCVGQAASTRPGDEIEQPPMPPASTRPGDEIEQPPMPPASTRPGDEIEQPPMPPASTRSGDEIQQLPTPPASTRPGDGTSSDIMAVWDEAAEEMKEEEKTPSGSEWQWESD